MNLDIDHLVVAVSDLGAGAEQIRQQTGLESLPGGRHPGHGTANAVLALGSEYIELVTVVDPNEAESSPFGRSVGAAIDSGGGLLAVCLRTDDLDAVAARAGLTATPMQRVRPDGVRLAWRLAGMEAALDTGLPFFIQWDTPTQLHPGHLPAALGGVDWVELPVEADHLDRWVGSTDLDLRPRPHRPALRAGLTVRGRTIAL